MRRHVLALLSFLVLAGCTGTETVVVAEDNAAMGPGLAANFDDDTGGIEGVVVSDSLAPIVGATVALVGRDVIQQSTEDGAFGFSYVAPGDVIVAASKDGFEGDVQSVIVEAGRATQLKLILRPLPTNEAYVETIISRGQIECGVSLRSPVPVLGYNHLAVGPCVSIDSYQTLTPISTLDDVAGLWIETQWLATQVAGRGLETYWGLNLNGETVPANNGNNIDFYFGIFHGHSPISAPVPPERMEAWLDATPAERSTCEGATCEIFGWHYVYADTVGPSSPIDAGFLFQQSYEDFVSVFHGKGFPETFTALPDQ